MIFSNLVDAIQKSGITTVISVVMIILFWRQYIKMENMNKQFVKFLTKSNNRTTAHEEGMKSRIDIASMINSIIKNITIKTGAARVYIIEFHNTSNNMTGLPFAKFSMTYEFFQEGITPVINQYQNMSLSLISPVINDLYSNSYLLVDSDNYEDDKLRSLQWFLNQRSSKTTIFVPLKDTTGKIFGIAGLDFRKKQNKEVWTLDEMEKKVFAECARISGYLDFKHI